MLRGDHELNEVKAQRVLGLSGDITFATEQQIKSAHDSAHLARSGRLA